MTTARNNKIIVTIMWVNYICNESGSHNWYGIGKQNHIDRNYVNFFYLWKPKYVSTVSIGKCD